MLYNNKILIKICIFLLSSVSCVYNAQADNLQMREAEDIDPFTMSNFHITLIGIELDNKTDSKEEKSINLGNPQTNNNKNDDKNDLIYRFIGLETPIYNNNLTFGFECGHMEIPKIINTYLEALFTAKLTYPIDLGSIGHISPMLRAGLGLGFAHIYQENRGSFGAVNFVAIGGELFLTNWFAISLQMQFRNYDFFYARAPKSDDETKNLSKEDSQDFMKTSELISISKKVNIENLFTIGFKINF